jgi:glycosyltransferase involved in cell wall biosynthesis
MKQECRKISLLILHRSHYPLTQRADEISILLYEKCNIYDVKVHIFLDHNLIQIKDSLRQSDINIPIYGCIFKKLSFSPLITSFLFLYVIFLLRKIFGKCKFDVCWTGDLFLASFSPILKLFGICKKFVYDDPDYYPACYSGILRIIVTVLESIVIKNSDLVISISENLAKIRRRQGAKIVKVVQHMVDCNFFKNAYETRLKRLFQQDFKPKTILYAGNFMDELKNDLLLHSLNIVNKSGVDFTFILLGSGNKSILNNFILNANKMGFGTKVLYLGSVPRKKLPEIFQRADIAICKLTPKYLYYGTTKKILEYMATGLPVIVSDLGLPHLLVKKGNCGFISSTEAENLSRVILKALKLSKDEIIKISKNARILAEQYDYSILGDKYCRILEGLI